MASATALLPYLASCDDGFAASTRWGAPATWIEIPIPAAGPERMPASVTMRGLWPARPLRPLSYFAEPCLGRPEIEEELPCEHGPPVKTIRGDFVSWAW